MLHFKKLLDCLNIKDVYGNIDLMISGISNDSRKVKEDFVFVCINGVKQNGKDYIREALSNGAKVIIAEEKINLENITIIVVPDARVALADISSCYYGNPSQKIKIVGITGTNGKTTITYLLESIFSVNQNRVGVIGTISYRIGEEVIPAENTTPSSLELQRILSKMVEEKIEIAVMEVSSHSIVQNRIKNCEFDSAVFTNLTTDHLDFHKTMDEYLKAKTKLFSGLGKKANKKNKKFAIINSDDEASEYIIKHTTVPVISYGIKKRADFFAEEINYGMDFTSFNLCTPQGKIKVCLNLVGEYNISNVLASSAVAQLFDIPLQKIKEGLENLKYVPGRFEVISEGQDFTCIVDYAHTPDALSRVLVTARNLHPNRVIAVFGCGGDRDTGKRPVMGEIAVENSDFVWITSDNPRSEDPEKITKDIEAGIIKTGKNNYKIVLDRYQALEEALNYAKNGDLVIVAGKGHEKYQVLFDKVVPFDERLIVREILKGIVGNK